MTKIVRCKYKISRRLGVSVWGRAKDPSITKNYKPGQHGPTGLKKAPSDYGNQLRAKQLLKGYYGRISEKQFHRTYEKAFKMRGEKTENFIGLLERRLDAFVYRLNLAPTIFGSRQLVSHGHIVVHRKKKDHLGKEFVNSTTVTIPSFQLNEGDIVELRESGRNIPSVIEAMAAMEREIPGYITLDAPSFKGSLVRIPKFADVPYPVKMDPQLVIEFYSK